MASLRILTFNFHEPYLCLLAKLGYPLTIGMFDRPPLHRDWLNNFRPMPKNITVAEEAQWREDLGARRFDVVVAHNENNAAQLYHTDVPAILVCHNRRTFLTDSLPPGQEETKRSFERLLDRHQERFNFVFISESKRDDYNVPGPVIPPGIDLDMFDGGYVGDTAEVLRIGNRMLERDLMFDVGFQENALRGLPNRLLGENPRMPGSVPSRSFEELLWHYRHLRCYLHVTREAYEDGYNLAMLEAMACGMPVVSLANRTSPLTHGRDGFLSDDARELRKHLIDLLQDPALAREIGEAGRETVAKAFPMDRFVERWRAVLEETAEKGPRGVHAQQRSVPRKRVLMEYTASPVTTGRYFEWALRKSHETVVAGFRCPEELLTYWGFPEPVPRYPAHEIDMGLESTYEEMLQRLPGGFEPDLFFYVDSSRKGVPEDIGRITVPKVCYLIDTHIEPEIRLNIARHFDYTFLAQKAQVDLFQQVGIPNVAWMPLGCSSDLHTNVWPVPRDLDVAFVGRFMEDADERRRSLIGSVCKRFPNSFQGQCWPAEMARLYRRAKIVINAAVNNDLNMRVFEALASGALLITDQAEGLEDLFEDGTHLVIYRNDDDLVKLVEHYLANDETRERIAAAGQACVLEHHTYANRLEEMFQIVAQSKQSSGGMSGESRFEDGGYYRGDRPELAAQVPLTAQRVLDVGCGGGDFGAALKRRGVREVVGIEIVDRACELAKQVLDDALLGNIEQMELPFEDGYFDCITFGDVLEHLVEPGAALRKLARVLAPDGLMVASIPNVRFCQVVAMLANGRWKYEDAGILDRTHLRFFTAIEMHELFTNAGLDVKTISPLSMLDPKQLPRNSDGGVTLGKVTIGPLDDMEYHDFLVYQYLIRAAKPHVDPLLDAQRAFDKEQYDEAYRLAEAADGADAFARHRLLGAACLKLDRMEEAEQHLRSALSILPRDHAATKDLGLLLLAREQVADAEPYLETALNADPRDDSVMAALATVAMRTGDPSRAFDLFAKALDASVEHEHALTHFLDLGETLGRREETEPVLRRFVDYYPARIDAALRFVRLLRDLGKTDEARQRLEMLTLFYPDHEEVRRLSEELGTES